MISKRLRSGGAVLALSLVLMGGSICSYAMAPEGADTDTRSVTRTHTEQPASESAAQPAAPQEGVNAEEAEEDAGSGTENEGESSEGSESSGVLTPTGNLSLVDNISSSDQSQMEFLTVTSKDGHTFYIIIDHDGSSDNVYFLNQIDESDLLPLLNSEEKEALEKAKKDAEAADEQAVQPSLTDTSGGSAAAESNKGGSQRLDNVLNNNLIMGGVFGVIALILITVYYFLKIRPGKGGSSVEDDLDFYDDEEYENEDDESEPDFDDETEEEKPENTPENGEYV